MLVRSSGSLYNFDTLQCPGFRVEVLTLLAHAVLQVKARFGGAAVERSPTSSVVPEPVRPLPLSLSVARASACALSPSLPPSPEEATSEMLARSSGSLYSFDTLQ